MFTQKIFEGDFSEAEIYGYKRNKLKLCLTWILYLATGFILRLIFYWLPRWYIILSHTRCSLRDADIVLCKDQYHQYWIHKLTYALKDGKIIKKCLVKWKRKEKLSSSKCLLEVNYKPEEVLKYFIHKKIKYVWNDQTSSFHKLLGLEQIPCSIFYQSMPLTDIECERNNALYGENFIDVKITSLVILLFQECLNPFYIFQICSFTLWYLDDYVVYASCIVVMSALSISIQLYETRKNETTLRKTVVSFGEALVCRRGKEYHSMNARELVPGDIIEIPRSGCIMHCDAVLITGNCIVNESMLTGESVPVTKTPLPNPSGMVPFSKMMSGDNIDTSNNDDLLDIKKHNRHILFCGTNIIQARNFDKEPIVAVVVRTGYLTAKGELVRSILFPKPIDVKFNKDAMKFVMMLFSFALIGLAYTVIIMLRRNVHIGKIIIRSLDLITIVVPPALPIAMTIGIVFAQTRLKKKKIFCISPNTINICGGINVTCFDKTGTLTEDGLDLWGVVASKVDGSFEEIMSDLHDLPLSPLVECMATCHSLTFIDQNLCGDPLDLKMFQSINWKLKDIGDGDSAAFDMSVPMIAHRKMSDENGSQEYNIGILRQFPFSSSLQRMAVITKLSSRTNFNVYVKGSPEVLCSLCRKETLPRDFSVKLLELTRQGYRVLALAFRPMKVSYSKMMRISRQEVESDLRFLGFLVMENRLKPETEVVIEELKAAMIRPVMVTGDNMLTALSVSRDCGIIAETDKVVLVDARRSSDKEGAIVEFHYAEDLQRHVKEISMLGNEQKTGDCNLKICMFDRSDFHLALSGKTWSIIREHCPQLIPKLVVKGSVFARFAPEQKTQLIEALQLVGYYVSMCGDGANDCGALKVAHAGISLSDAEASVASPFTSKVQNISCVPELIKEGRCALTTSFGTFKFMAGYSFTQFISVLILYWITANLGDYQFLYIDLIVITALSITCGYTKAYQTLSIESPSVRLLTVPMVSSLVLQWTLNAAVQVAAYLYVYSQPWYFVPKMHSNDIIHDAFAVTAVFSVSVFQYIIIAVIFSKGPPFRAPFYTNYLFLCNFVVVLALSVYVCMKPFHWLKKLLNLVTFPSLWINVILLSFVFANFLISYLIEFVIDNMSLRQKMLRLKVSLFPQSVNQFEYEKIREEIDKNTTVWPPIIKSASVQDMRPEIFTDTSTIHGSHSAQDLINYKDKKQCEDMDVLHEEIESDDFLPLRSSTFNCSEDNVTVKFVGGSK